MILIVILTKRIWQLHSLISIIQLILFICKKYLLILI